MQDFITALERSLSDGTFVKLTLGHYTGREADLKNLLARRVAIKGVDHLGFTWRHKTRDIAKNHKTADGVAILRTLIGHDFLAGTLCTLEADYVFDTPPRGKPRMSVKPPSQTSLPDTAHDHQKKRAIDSAGRPWLHALGIADAKGVVLKSAQDKFRQINRYIELLAPMLSPDIRRVVDMGAGKGYLTFALYDYLRGQGIDAQVRGVEMRPDLVALCNDIARENDFTGLDFIAGKIADEHAAGADMLIALHACDTATDDAIAAGVRAGAKIIVVAPCCHKQIRRAMEQTRDPGDFLLGHGIFLERQAEMVTDALRALILRSQGYRVKAFEFISDSHTPKNVMITAEKAGGPDAAILPEITAAKARFGITRHALEDRLGL